MLEFFDYFYYRCYQYYIKKDKEGIPTFWSSCILSVAVGLNILFIVYLFGFSTIGVSFKPDKYKVVMGAGIIWFIAVIRYKYFVTFFSLYEKWHKEPKAEKVRKGKRIVAYFIGSLAFVVVLLPLLKLMLS